MIRLLSLFTGIGAFESALKSLNIPYELVGFSEVDKFAIKSYCAIHNVDEKYYLSEKAIGRLIRHSNKIITID